MNIRTVWSVSVRLCALVSIALLAGCGGGSGSASSTIGSHGTVTSVQVTPASAAVYQGQTIQFAATVVGQSNQAVIWSIQPGSFGTIDSTGLYTAPKDASGGPIQISATSQADPTATGLAAVTIVPIVVKISPSSVTLTPGGTQTFSVTIEGLADSSVTWTVQEAGGGIINNAGFYAAPVSTGYFHVIATSVADGTRSGSASVTVTTSSSSFTPTGDMQVARGFHTATLLGSNKVLVVGGAVRSADGYCLDGLDSAELYDPGTGSFSKTGNSKTPLYAHTATLLQNGEVLVTGGFASNSDCLDQGGRPQVAAEVYNPATGAFENTGSMVEGRGGHTATLLPNGKVLIAGGGDQGGSVLPFFGNSSNTAELYDPVAGVFTPTGSMVTARCGHTSTLLTNGKVLIVGGLVTYGPDSDTTSTAEIYDPATGNFTPTGSMAFARAGHTATLLNDGRVLIAGGLADTNDYLSTPTAEIYDPNTGKFSPTGDMGVARRAHTATLLANGTVLIAGGEQSSPTPFAEIYDPATGSFIPTGSMGTARVGHTATLLPDGRVLVAGGGYFLTSAELYK